jgi:Ca-activated chloride channel homolog
MHHFRIAFAIALHAVTAAAQVSEAPEPVSMGIVLDSSGSMGPNMRLVRGLLNEFAKSAGSADEFALIQASDRPVILSGFVKASDLESRIEFLTTRGRSALLDAVYMGSQLVRTGRNARKVLLVISDGGDRSRFNEIEIRESLAQTRVLVYTVGTTDSGPGMPGIAFLKQLADDGRGRFATVSRSSDLPALAQELSTAIRRGQ